MKSSIATNLLWLSVFLGLIYLRHFAENESKREVVKVEEKKVYTEASKNFSLDQKSYPLFYAAFKNAVKAQQPEARLVAINKALEYAAQEKVETKEAIRVLHVMAADIHQYRWHIHYAIEHLAEAQAFVFDKNTDNRLNQLRHHLTKIQTERNFNDDYIATRFSGPAKTFSGKILITYIFIDDGIKTKWSKNSILKTQQVLKQVETWSQTRANEYKISNLSFENKIFIVQRNPKIKQLGAITSKSPRIKIEQFIQASVEGLGKNNLGDFIKEQVDLAQADQGVVIFHSNFDDRSFAKRCGYTHKRKFLKDGKYQTEMLSNCREEYVVLMNQVKRNRWDKLHYTQAHEILHLFGADDLYSIKKAKDYAVTDIMNYQSKRLDDSDILPITAYAIGWQKLKPNTPFKILDK